MRLVRTLLVAALSASWAISTPAAAAPRHWNLPPGFAIQQVAGPPLVDRPITAALDNAGRLYVGDSSGSNDPMDQQLKERTHRIIRLEDTDGDGQYDQSRVFADQMMFPEGTMFYDGSLYVAAPPSIWKLTDTDDDGVADQRSEWFRGGTLTGCANDLHGPYRGLDGMIYWCKGAWAEQTHNVNGRPWTTKAAHIFRCRPDGTHLEPVMTGGMDNPVDMAFTPTGDKLFTSTFLVHPSGGQRDGVARALYGAVHGKSNSAVAGHPRTGPLMPVLTHLGAAAPSGLERYDSPWWGADYQHSLFVCQFNTRKVSRHTVTDSGASLQVFDHEFLSTDDVDFHPTDVIADADGSLLVIDTGGWYKICCPTSQLEKADVLGAIYRVRRLDSRPASDPRGRDLVWSELRCGRLWELLADERSFVRRRATQEFVGRVGSAELTRFLTRLARDPATGLGVDSAADRFPPALTRIWTLGQLRTAAAASLVRAWLQHENRHVRKTAAQVVSLNRDAAAVAELRNMLASDVPANQRVAAEALGRIGDAEAADHLLAAAGKADDHDLRHSIVFALIELNDAATVSAGLDNESPGTHAAALIACDQIPGFELAPERVVPLLDASPEILSNASYWLVSRHPEWGPAVAHWLRDQLTASPAEDAVDDAGDPTSKLASLLVRFAGQPPVAELMAQLLLDADVHAQRRAMILQAMARAKPKTTPVAWLDATATLIARRDGELATKAIAALREFSLPDAMHDGLQQALLGVVNDDRRSADARVAALSVLSPWVAQLAAPQFELLANSFHDQAAASRRRAAAEALSRAQLSTVQLREVCSLIEAASPLELNLLLTPFADRADDSLGLQLLGALEKSTALPALQIALLRELLSDCGPPVQAGIEALHQRLNVDLESQRARIQELLEQTAGGDVRRGHAVFHSSKGLCSTCHRLGYGGGSTGPDLSKIGAVRTRADLLESVVYPSLSFVRSYEPVVVLTHDGRAINGLIRDESDAEIRLATGPDQEIRLSKTDVDKVKPSRVSIMPAGLDKQLTMKELADLMAFLESRGK